LNIPINNFQIYGDLPGEVIERLNRNFGIGASAGAGASSNDKGNNKPGAKPTASVPASSTTSSSPAVSTGTSTPASDESNTPPRHPTGQSRNDVADFVKSMAEKNPGDPKMMELAEQLAQMPIRSREVNAMLFAPPTSEELEMIRRQTQN